MSSLTPPPEHQPAFAPTLSAEPAARPSRRSSLHATTSRDSQADQASIDEALASKRRKSSLVPGVPLHLHRLGTTSRRKRADTHDLEEDHRNQHHHDILHSPERAPPRRTGPPVEAIDDDLDTEEGRRQQEEIQQLIAEANEAQANITAKAGVQFLKDKQPWPEFRPNEEYSFPPREFVWDVLFENQRGLYIFGKAYFSSMSLLPFDPSPYTLPQRPLPAASSNFLVSHPEGQTQIPSTENKSAAPRGRNNIKTAYTPDTLQLPTPAWEWLTPWMINMRTGTDEMGWRYNSVFKRKGWSSKAGPGGWGGWVRRREWVRLRCIKPQVKQDGDGDEDGKDEGAAVKHGRKEDTRRQTLKGIFQENEEGERRLYAIAKQLELDTLDREKLETWQKWLEEIQDDAGLRHELEALLQDPVSTSLRYIKRQLTYGSSKTQLESLFAEHDLLRPTTVSDSSSTAHTRTPSLSGYDV